MENTLAEAQRCQVNGQSSERPYRFEVGDLVWLYNPAVPRGNVKKLAQLWTGPYRIQVIVGDVNFRVRHVQGGKSKYVHYDRLKPCYRCPLTTNNSESRECKRSSIEGIVPDLHIGSGSEVEVSVQEWEPQRTELFPIGDVGRRTEPRGDHEEGLGDTDGSGESEMDGSVRRPELRGVEGTADTDDAEESDIDEHGGAYGPSGSSAHVVLPVRPRRTIRLPARLDDFIVDK